MANRRRWEIFAWALYDWANSAYSTILITIIAAYLQKIVLPGKTGEVAYAWGISFSMLLAALASPVLGAMADARANKRIWLAATALGGAACAVLLGLTPPDWPWVAMGVFAATSLLFELSLGFYNAFLPEIADETAMNRVSAWGFALGYLGGGLALVLDLLILSFGPSLGLPNPADQLRAGIVVMGLWWGGFTLPALWLLRDRGPLPLPRPTLAASARQAVREVARTLNHVGRYRILAVFLLGFLFYNEGVQTVISQASTFAMKELHFETTELVPLILAVQFVALPGALAVGWLADRLGQKRVLMGCLAVWVGLLVAALLVTTKLQFWCLAGVLALVMGGIQSLSRAVMGVMTPPSRAAEFFGFFNFSSKATSFMGPFVFGWMIVATDSARAAIFSLLAFFLVGAMLIARLDVEKGRRQAWAAELEAKR